MCGVLVRIASRKAGATSQVANRASVNDNAGDDGYGDEVKFTAKKGLGQC